MNEAPSAKEFVHIRIACPGTVPSAPTMSASSGTDHANNNMLVEQFECAAESCVRELKVMIEERTRFPSESLVSV